MNTVHVSNQKVRMVAHRGLSGLEAQNTNLAFVAAGNRSYWGVETDVHCTADGKFIIIHDDDTKHMTGVSRVVEETDFATLRSMPLYDVDGTLDRVDLRMPTLEEYLRICKKYEKICVLELKNHMSEEQVRRIMDIAKEEYALEQMVFISFDFENLVFVRNYNPAQKVQFLFGEFTEEIIEQVRRHRFGVDVYYKSITKEVLTRLHALGIEVNCWTVNDAEDAQRLMEWGVDYITTNILE